jgi:hypothetical protein
MWIRQVEPHFSYDKKSRRHTEGKSLLLEVLSPNATNNDDHCLWTQSRHHFHPSTFSQIIFLISVLILSFTSSSFLHVGGHGTAQAVSCRLLMAGTRFRPLARPGRTADRTETLPNAFLRDFQCSLVSIIPLIIRNHFIFLYHWLNSGCNFKN